eukprot:TRINITY_DN8984_c0_g1_i2.p1 TRINITY_DN8984_c0_g1~~TRINITY_DN8984_c0_g1_i2.p1  ORF type:complete len:148 (-),score=42.33 TRINITY_DN8984_c0_g1_i2:123-566(-)
MCIRDRFDINLDPKIVDFGVSIPFPKGVTKTNQIPYAGTKRYMPPETMGESITSFSGDIYALGIIIFEFLSGQVGWDPQESQQKESTLNKDIFEIINQCISKQIEKRPTVEQLKLQIDEIIKKEKKIDELNEQEQLISRAAEAWGNK